jgi:dUTP pyrophosphatase
MIQVKLLTENSKSPSRNTPTDAGLDLYSSETILVRGREWKAVSAGISMSIPDGYYARIAPRSGLAYKYGIDVFAGVVDSGYRGEIKVILYNAGEKDYLVNIGDKIAQLIIEKCYLWDLLIVNDLDASDRGERGFGSSGK